MRYIATIHSREISIDQIDLVAGSASIDGKTVRFDFQPLRPGLYSLILDNRVYTVQVQNGKIAAEIAVGSHHAGVVVEDDRALLLRKLGRTATDTGVLEIQAPMPGLIVRTHAGQGETVKKGQRLVTIEAMKMENEIKSPTDGVVEEVFVSEWDVVEKGERLLKLQKAASGAS